MALSKKHREQIQGMTNRELVAFHNVLTMSYRCIMGKEDRQLNRMKLAAVDQEIRNRRIVKDGDDFRNRLINTVEA